MLVVSDANLERSIRTQKFTEAFGTVKRVVPASFGDEISNPTAPLDAGFAETTSLLANARPAICALRKEVYYDGSLPRSRRHFAQE
jgi:hypothetical protein